MWEFLYDVTVVEVGHSRAAYRNQDVPFLKHAIWLVESEVTDNGTEIAKDLSKLRVGTADYKLLIARTSTQPDQQPWLDFIGRLAEGITGTLFLGLMPTYSSARPREARKWHDCEAAITLYQCRSNGPGPVLRPMGVLTHHWPAE